MAPRCSSGPPLAATMQIEWPYWTVFEPFAWRRPPRSRRSSISSPARPRAADQPQSVRLALTRLAPPIGHFMSPQPAQMHRSARRAPPTATATSTTRTARNGGTPRRRPAGTVAAAAQVLDHRDRRRGASRHLRRYLDADVAVLAAGPRPACLICSMPGRLVCTTKRDRPARHAAGDGARRPADGGSGGTCRARKLDHH